MPHAPMSMTNYAMTEESVETAHVCVVTLAGLVITVQHQYVLITVLVHRRARVCLLVYASVQTITLGILVR